MMKYLEPATEQKGSAARRVSITKLTTASSSVANLLSIFLGAGSSEPKPKRSFYTGGVGLSIVAAMSRAGLAEAEPIAIGAVARRHAREEAALSESYTCVISHVDGNGVQKRVYFGFSDCGSGGGGGWLVEPDKMPAPAADFLSRCFLCDKRLDGLDIYMYRGEKAFCSAECRCHQMLIDDHAENCGSEALKSSEYSASPCPAPLALSPSVVWLNHAYISQTMMLCSDMTHTNNRMILSHSWIQHAYSLNGGFQAPMSGFQQFQWWLAGSHFIAWFS